MLPVLVFLVLLAASVTAQLNGTLTSTPPVATQQVTSPHTDCNATCAAFKSVEGCHKQNCECTERYFEAVGTCFVCKAKSLHDAASVQIFLNNKMNQCHAAGRPVQFMLSIPPGAQTIINEHDRQSAVLRKEQKAFLALQIAGGHVGLVMIIALAIIYRKVHRDPTFFNFCLTWTFSSVFYSISLYRGTDKNTLDNPLNPLRANECLVQACLINGAQAMTACSTLALVFKLWISLRAAVHGELPGGVHGKRCTTIMLLASPYILGVAFFSASALIPRISERPVLPANFYCYITENEPAFLLQAIYGVTLGLLVVTAFFDVLILIILYRHRSTFPYEESKSVVSVPVLIRVVVFSIYRVTVAIAYGSLLERPPQLHVLRIFKTIRAQRSYHVPVWVDMLQAAIPLVIFFIFSMNMHVARSAMFWRKREKAFSSV